VRLWTWQTGARKTTSLSTSTRPRSWSSTTGREDPIHINGVAVERVDSFNFLGIHITEKYTYYTHTLLLFTLYIFQLFLHYYYRIESLFIVNLLWLRSRGKKASHVFWMYVHLKNCDNKRIWIWIWMWSVFRCVPVIKRGPCYYISLKYLQSDRGNTSSLSGKPASTGRTTQAQRDVTRSWTRARGLSLRTRADRSRTAPPTAATSQSIHRSVPPIKGAGPSIRDKSSAAEREHEWIPVCPVLFCSVRAAFILWATITE